MRHSESDTVIVGAGAAGLVTAARLAQAGHPVLVLEARDRIGGRIWTRHEASIEAPIELGAEFVHGRAPENVAWLKIGGKTPIAMPDSHWSVKNGELRQRDGLFEEIQKSLRRYRALASHELSLDSFLRSRIKDKLSGEAREYVRMMAEGFDAADPVRASSSAIVEEWTGDAMTDAPQSRPDGGYSSLLMALAGALPADLVRIKLQSAVREIKWSSGSVTVKGQGIDGPFQIAARRAVITLPLGVLQLPADAPHAVRFTPSLDAKQSALAGLGSGAVVKLLLKFRTAFWQQAHDEQYRDATFFHAPKCPFPTFWTPLPLRAALLVAWAGGPRAEKLSQLGSIDKITEQALRSLEAMFGKKLGLRAQLDGAYLHDWQRDAFAAGAYSYVAVGGKNAREQLAAPLQQTLFFAGEATDTSGEAATVTGALLSGERCAGEISAAVSRGRTPGSRRRLPRAPTRKPKKQ